MLRINTITNAASAKGYYQQSDYYLEAAGEWIGTGAARLGLEGKARQADFEAVCDNINPQTGERLTAMMVDHRRVGWDFNFNASKSVSLAREIIGRYRPEEGQEIEDAHREAVAYTMGWIEKDIACRVRVDGKDEDRVTGNMIAMRVTHRTTRPNADDKTPDPEIHDHVVLMNATFDDVEGKVKAVQNETLYKSAPYYEAMYHNRLAANLKALDYGLRRKGKGFEIEGITDAMIDTYSRRTKTIDEKARALGITGDEAKSRLGATTRLGKSEAVVTDLPRYWDAKLGDSEREQILSLKGRPGYESTAETSVAYAIGHEFQRNSVIDPRRLYETAMRHGIGSVTPEDVEQEAMRQGVLFKDGLCTTEEVLDQERGIISFARMSRGAFTPLNAGRTEGLDGLSAEQKAAVRHIWDSTDQVVLVRGGAGTGKTTMMTPALGQLGAPVVLLAPSSDASRDTLRKEGFKDANTVAAFLGSEDMQAGIRDGGIIWVDEAGMLSIDDLEKLCQFAKKFDARIVLQGDSAQHQAVDRNGNMLEVLHTHAGLPVAKLTTIQRQKGDYAAAVGAIRDRDFDKGDAILRKLGWVVEGEGHDALAREYAKAIEERKADGEHKTVLVVDPTNRDGDLLTEKLRAIRKEKGLITGNEKTFTRLVPLHLTDAQKGDATQYRGDEVIQFFRKSGRYKPGMRVKASELLPHLAKLKPKNFAAFEETKVSFAVGDTVRITSNGRDVTGKHRVDNGRIDTIRAFTGDGGIQLANGWVIGQDFAHIKHGLVSTSFATQSKTNDIVLAAMNRASLGAVSAEQAYVTISRGRERGMVFTDLSQEELLAAIARDRTRKSATELFATEAPAAEAAAVADHPNRFRQFAELVRETYRRLRLYAQETLPELTQKQEPAYER